MATPSQPVGQAVSHYRILRKIGGGGMGVVYEAEDVKLGRHVALKFLPEELTNDVQALERFRREARAASALNHPNICTIYEIDEVGGRAFIAMELLDGETLRQRINGKALELETVLNVGIQIAQGLAAAHDKGIVHRDLKPENLFVTRDRRIKILDFGLAKLTQAKADSIATARTLDAQTQPGVVMGTVGYMSPEQVRGEAADHRADIFAFGAILYEMLTGKRAFQGASAVETMGAILKHDPISAVDVVPTISPELQHIVHRCLEKDPGQRFHSASDLAFALQSSPSISKADLPVQAHRRLRTTPITLAVLILLFALTLLWRFRPWSESKWIGPGTQIHSLAVLPLNNFSSDPAQEYFVDGMTEELITRLSTIGSLRVISRTSVMQYKNVRKPLPQIAKELNVDAVVEGSVLRSGDRVRITAQLLEAQNDKHLWAESYERDLKDIFALQADVARDITDQVRVRVTQQEQSRLARAERVNPLAVDAYEKGRYYTNQRTLEGIKAGLAYFQQAIEADDRFAPAYAGLATAYGVAGFYGALSDRESNSRARAAAQKAIDLDDTLAEAHGNLAGLFFDSDHDPEHAEHEYRYAIALNPNYAHVHNGYSIFLSALLRNPEALREAKRAYELDPLSPAIGINYPWTIFMLGEPEEGIRQMREYVVAHPERPFGHWQLGKAFAWQHQEAQAIAQFQRALELQPQHPQYLCWLSYSYGRSGNRKEATRILQRVLVLSKDHPVHAADVAVAYIGLGDKQKALDWLERGLAETDPLMVFMAMERSLNPLRSEPRFNALVHRLNFPPSVEHLAIR
jgi:eukaryotic-like serine/threonine-protein kinase